MFHYHFSVIALSLFSSSLLYGQDLEIADLASKLSSQIAESRHKTIAVIGFSSETDSPLFGHYLVNHLANQLASSRRGFQVVTRSRTDEVLKELHTRYRDGFNDKTFAELGQLVGADAIITGDYTRLADRLNVGAQVIDVKTGLIIGASDVKVNLTDEVQSLLGSSVSPPRGTPPLLGQQTANAGARGNRSLPMTEQTRMPQTEVEGVIVQLQGCAVVASSIVCNFVMLAKEDDITLNLWSQASRCFDQEGREFRGSSIDLGNRSGAFLNDQLLVQSIPTKGRIIFQEANRRATQLSLLSIRFSDNRHNRQVDAQFRQVPLN